MDRTSTISENCSRRVVATELSRYTRALSAGVNILYRERPTITAALSIGGATTVVYDGTTYVPSLSYTGAEIKVGGAPNFTGTITGSAAKNAQVSPYKFSATNVATDLGYAVNPVSDFNLTITPKSLTVSGLAAQDKVYDSTSVATVVQADARLAPSVSGVVASDVGSVSLNIPATIAARFADPPRQLRRNGKNNPSGVFTT